MSPSAGAGMPGTCAEAPDGGSKAPREGGALALGNVGERIDDADAHCERARKSGAKIVDEPKTSDYGEDYWSDRSYRAEDREGHPWWFMQRVATRGKPA